MHRSYGDQEIFDLRLKDALGLGLKLVTVQSRSRVCVQIFSPPFSLLLYCRKYYRYLYPLGRGWGRR